MFIYDYFTLDDASFNQKYFFISVVYESSSKNLCFFVVSFTWKSDECLFCFFGTRHIWLQFECYNNSSNITFPLYSHAQMFSFKLFHFGAAFAYHFITGNEILFLKVFTWEFVVTIYMKCHEIKFIAGVVLLQSF